MSEQNPILPVLIVLIITFELLLTVIMGIIAKRKINHQLLWIDFVGKALSKADEDEIMALQSQQTSFPALAYLVSCTEKGQQVNSVDFTRLLTDRVDKQFASVASLVNTLPIIGLMGTFLGILFGISSIRLENVSSTISTAVDTLAAAPDTTSVNTASAITPLINSAGLAFSSSFVALLCASILKVVLGKWRKDADAVIEKAEQSLLIDYLPNTSGNTTDEIFAKSVRRLERSVRGFSASFEKVSTDFIAQFKPLVEEQREINQKTAQHIDSIASKLDENSRALINVSDKQIQQVNLFSSVATKLTEASDSLQASMKLASENLERFVKLGDEMQLNIGKMHEPLQEIISGQKESVDTLKNLYKNVESYDTNVQEYLKSLNAKLDMFKDVGDKVHEVRKDFEDFSSILDKILKQITDQAQDLHKDLRDSFTLYDSNLRTLFTDVLENRRDIHMAYYDPEVIKNLDKACSENKALLDTMEKHLHSLGTTTDKFIGIIEKLRGWGIYRVRRGKDDNDRLGR